MVRQGLKVCFEDADSRCMDYLELFDDETRARRLRYDEIKSAEPRRSVRRLMLEAVFGDSCGDDLCAEERDPVAPQ